MTTHAPRLPFSLDPLMAEAKRRMRKRRLGGAVLLAIALAVLAAVLALRSLTPPGSNSASSTGGVPTHTSNGEVVGSIRVVGGPAGVFTHKNGGLMTVYNAHGHVIRRVLVQTGHDFRLRLAPGPYRLGFGRHPRSLWGCPHPSIATIRSGRTTHQNLLLGCNQD